MSIKRFIAGAVCPRCGAQDRIRMWRDEAGEHRECVSCDYRDSLDSGAGAGPASPAGDETGVQVINILPGPGGGKE